MSENFEGDFIVIEDDEGRECRLEIVSEMDYNGKSYMLFLPADMNEDDPDYGFIILRSQYDENNDEYFESIEDDAEEEEVYEKFMTLLYDEDEE